MEALTPGTKGCLMLKEDLERIDIDLSTDHNLYSTTDYY